MSSLRSAWWLGAALLAPTAYSQSPTLEQQALRDIYKELVEINTTDSAGNCTEAAQALAARLKTAGVPAQDVQVIAPPDGPKKGNLVVRYRGTGTKKPI